MTRRAPIFVAALVGASVAALPVRAQTSLEYHVKAAFLLNFARFIEWPDSAFPDSRAPISVCVFAVNPFGEALQKTVQSEMASGRPLAVREVARRNCRRVEAVPRRGRRGESVGGRGTRAFRRESGAGRAAGRVDQRPHAPAGGWRRPSEGGALIQILRDILVHSRTVRRCFSPDWQNLAFVR